MSNPKSSNRTKRIDFTHHVVRECVDVGGILVEAFGTEVMVAEYLTTSLPEMALNECRAALGLTYGEAGTAQVGVLAPGPHGGRTRKSGRGRPARRWPRLTWGLLRSPRLPLRR